MITIKECNDQSKWDEYVLYNNGHPLQLWGWGEVKATHNWRAYRLFILKDDIIIASAQVLLRQLPKPFKSLAYIPRGPIVLANDQQLILNKISEFVKESFDSVAISIEPDTEEEFSLEGWKQSKNTILVPRTIIIDLGQGTDALQADMSKKTRQYIRKSSAEKMIIRQVKDKQDLENCLEIYKQTAERANFALHNDDYYYDIATMMGDYSVVFASFVDDKPVAFLWLLISKQTAFELYGGVNEIGQNMRANYALKWHAISKMKQWGIIRYDLNGLLNDGISNFKQGFASHENKLVGTYDRPLSGYYSLWQKGLPAMKSVLRKIKSVKKSTRS